jgi:hypothetical protein
MAIYRTAQEWRDTRGDSTPEDMKLKIDLLAAMEKAADNSTIDGTQIYEVVNPLSTDDVMDTINNAIAFLKANGLSIVNVQSSNYNYYDTDEAKWKKVYSGIISWHGTPPEPNFQITADWGTNGVTDKASFETFISARTGQTFVVSQFSLVENVLTCLFTFNETALLLDLSNCNISAVSKLSCDATQIDLNNNQIVDFNPTIALSASLQNINLSVNQIVNFNPTIALPTSLQSLDLNNNQIVDFNPTIALPPSLQNINLSFNQIVDFNPTIALPASLQSINLSVNQIVDFNPTIALPVSLQTIDLNSNQIVEFNPTIALPTSLLSINLNTNLIVDFNPTIALPESLQVLALNTNQIVDFNPSIALPTSLQVLDLSSNEIVYFNPTIVLPTSLNTLALQYNKMTIAGYVASETWANSQPSFINNCTIALNLNLDSVTGTDLEAILITKNATVIG